MSKNIPGNNLSRISVIWNEALMQLVYSGKNEHFIAQFPNTQRLRKVPANVEPFTQKFNSYSNIFKIFLV
jgi:hypothetical protein